MARKVKAKRKLIFGVGINDADYQLTNAEFTTVHPDGPPIRKITWICPFYKKWRRMLSLCYSKGVDRSKAPTVCDAWLTFSTFKSWMEQQDWEGQHLDYRLLVPGSMLYSPATCCLVSKEVGSFFNGKTYESAEFLPGIFWSTARQTFMTVIKVRNKGVYIGSYTSLEEAFDAWLNRKRELAMTVADNESDPRVKPAIIALAKNYPIPDFSAYPTWEELRAMRNAPVKERVPPTTLLKSQDKVILKSSLATKALNEALSRRRS